jgi:hypothetical protein
MTALVDGPNSKYKIEQFFQTPCKFNNKQWTEIIHKTKNVNQRAAGQIHTT